MRIFLIVLFCLTNCYFHPLYGMTRREIDQKIIELKEEKSGYEARALYHESVGERLQFVDGMLLTARKHFRLADENRKKAALIQQEIDDLEQKKRRKGANFSSRNNICI